MTSTACSTMAALTTPTSRHDGTDRDVIGYLCDNCYQWFTGVERNTYACRRQSPGGAVMSRLNSLRLRRRP